MDFFQAGLKWIVGSCRSIRACQFEVFELRILEWITAKIDSQVSRASQVILICGAVFGCHEVAVIWCGDWTSGWSLEQSQRSFVLNRRRMRSFRHLIGMLPGHSVWRLSKHILLGGDPGVYPAPAAGIINLIWPGNTLGTPRRSWKVLLRRDSPGSP